MTNIVLRQPADRVTSSRRACYVADALTKLAGAITMTAPACHPNLPLAYTGLTLVVAIAAASALPL